MILNLTQHNSSTEQIEQGLVEPEDKALVKELLTLRVNSPEEMRKAIDTKVQLLLNVADSHRPTTILVGGHPGLIAVLVGELKFQQYKVVMSHTDRVVVEKAGVKTSVFKHKFFYEV